MEVPTYISCMDTAYVRETPPQTIFGTWKRLVKNGVFGDKSLHLKMFHVILAGTIISWKVGHTQDITFLLPPGCLDKSLSIGSKNHPGYLLSNTIRGISPHRFEEKMSWKD